MTITVRRVTPDLDQIRGLIAAIEKLNAEILETEKLVNSRAQSASLEDDRCTRARRPRLYQKRPYIKQHLACPTPKKTDQYHWPRIQRSVLVSWRNPRVTTRSVVSGS